MIFEVPQVSADFMREEAKFLVQEYAQRFKGKISCDVCGSKTFLPGQDTWHFIPNTYESGLPTGIYKMHRKCMDDCRNTASTLGIEDYKFICVAIREQKKAKQ